MTGHTVIPAPEWFGLARSLMPRAFQATSERLAQVPNDSPHLRLLPTLALDHLAACIESSAVVNKQGRHALGLCLTRQSLEALTVVEIGVHVPATGDILAAWAEGRRSSGELRKALEASVWPKYGPGLWNEPWAEFFGNLARAVQPYAHYTAELAQWQICVSGSAFPTEHDTWHFHAATGSGSFDSDKALRVLLLHALITWCLSRILQAVDPPDPSALRPDEVAALGSAIGRSTLLVPRADWGIQLAPHTVSLQSHSAYCAEEGEE